MSSVLQKKYLAPLALTAAVPVVSAGVWLLWKFDPNATHSVFPKCAFLQLTGWYCPGCGLTRALHALVHGDVLQAFVMNPLVISLLFFIPLLILWHKQIWQPRLLAPLMSLAAKPAFWIIMLPSYWVARNLPWFPFTLLAPS